MSISIEWGMWRQQLSVPIYRSLANIKWLQNRPRLSLQKPVKSDGSEGLTCPGHAGAAPSAPFASASKVESFESFRAWQRTSGFDWKLWIWHQLEQRLRANQCVRLLKTKREPFCSPKCWCCSSILFWYTVLVAGSKCQDRRMFHVLHWIPLVRHK